MRAGEVLAQVWWVGIGGFVGANARYWIGVWVQARFGQSFPWGTFLINVSGCFLLALLMTLLAERFGGPRAPVLRLVLAVGFLGAYTTFSTFEYETFALVSAGNVGRALANALGSLAAGYLAVWLGVAIARAA